MRREILGREQRNLIEMIEALGVIPQEAIDFAIAEADTIKKISAGLYLLIQLYDSGLSLKNIPAENWKIEIAVHFGIPDTFAISEAQSHFFREKLLEANKKKQ